MAKTGGKIGHIVTEETRRKIRLKLTGRKLSSTHIRNIKINTKGKKHGPLPFSAKQKLSLINKGDKCHFWKGGISSKNRLIRRSFEYKIWRQAVFERDNYTCIWCKTTKKYLNADHIKPFAFYPELRFAIDNGRTLCEACHRKTDTWGVNSLTRKLG